MQDDTIDLYRPFLASYQSLIEANASDPNFEDKWGEEFEYQSLIEVNARGLDGCQAAAGCAYQSLIEVNARYQKERFK